MLQTLFPPDVGLSILHKRFERMDIGQLHSSLPIKALAALLDSPKEGPGAKPWFNNEGKIALQFLKMYESCSDEKLLSKINTDWSLQMFCGIQLGPNQEIRDKDLIWKIRKEVAQKLDIQKFQEVLIEFWKPEMENSQMGLTDATAYESYISYPTDVKLLWSCIEWLQTQTKFYCKAFGIKRPRNKYKDQKKKHQNFSRKRRKYKKERIKRIKASLYLLDKMLKQFTTIIILDQEKENEREIQISQEKISKYLLLGKVYEQQKYHLENPKESIPNRIVSLFKPYLRPIVRGKENKRVEFGAKVNSWQVDGINFIEHYSFSAFHEGIRLKQGIAFHHKNFGKLKQLGADQIYATRENRRTVKKLNIATNFIPVGRRTHDNVVRKQEDQLRKVIGKARSTTLEGSYGNDKNHYNLRKVKARTQITEIAWIFFGMMTANASKIAKRKQSKAKLQLSKAA